MSKHILFFVHGIGDEAKKWSATLRANFSALYDSYPLPPGGRPFDELFQTEEIFYNDLFDEWRQRAGADARRALDALGTGGLAPDVVTRLSEAAASAGGGGFLRTHALDVAQYRFLRLVSDAVRDAVQHQIMSRLADSDFGVPVRWSIIGHSLGTAVVHDTLQQMFRPGAGAENSSLFQPYAVVMLANVSQLLHNPAFLGAGVDAYKSFVTPRREPAAGACRYYLSAANGFDPVAIAGGFAPPAQWLDDAANKQRRFRPLEFRAIPQNRQVHGFAEYLAHPAVHVPLFRILAGDQDLITETQEADAHAKYNRENPLPGAGDVERRAIEAVMARASRTDWFERIAVWKDVIDKFTKR